MKSTMSPDMNRLRQLLGRLRELEQRVPGPNESPILEVGRNALRDEVMRLAHALHDNTYWRTVAVPDRHAS